jgi:hypothetical protein
MGRTDMFGNIGEKIGEILRDNNLGDMLSQINLDSMASIRESLESLNLDQAIPNLDALLGDLSDQAQNMVDDLPPGEHAAGDPITAEAVPAAAAADDLATIEVHGDADQISAPDAADAAHVQESMESVQDLMQQVQVIQQQRHDATIEVIENLSSHNNSDHDVLVATTIDQDAGHTPATDHDDVTDDDAVVGADHHATAES